MRQTLAEQFRDWLLRPVMHHLDTVGAQIMAASQADIDAVTAKLGDLKAALVNDDAAIQTEITSLSNQGVDVSGLQTALDDLSSQVDATTALVPAPDAGA